MLIITTVAGVFNMLVRVFLFNKDLCSIAVSIEHDNNIPYLESSSLYMESANSTAKRIVRDSFKVELDESRIKLVRQ